MHYLDDFLFLHSHPDYYLRKAEDSQILLLPGRGDQRREERDHAESEIPLPPPASPQHAVEATRHPTVEERRTGLSYNISKPRNIG